MHTRKFQIVPRLICNVSLFCWSLAISGSCFVFWYFGICFSAFYLYFLCFVVFNLQIYEWSKEKSFLAWKLQSSMFNSNNFKFFGNLRICWTSLNFVLILYSYHILDFCCNKTLTGANTWLFRRYKIKHTVSWRMDSASSNARYLIFLLLFTCPTQGHAGYPTNNFTIRVLKGVFQELFSPSRYFCLSFLLHFCPSCSGMVEEMMHTSPINKHLLLPHFYFISTFFAHTGV